MKKSTISKKFIEDIICDQQSNVATVYLLNGTPLVGNVVDYDDNNILLSTHNNSREILVFNNAIASMCTGFPQNKYKTRY